MMGSLGWRGDGVRGPRTVDDGVVAVEGGDGVRGPRTVNDGVVGVEGGDRVRGPRMVDDGVVGVEGGSRPLAIIITTGKVDNTLRQDLRRYSTKLDTRQIKMTPARDPKQEKMKNVKKK